MSDLLGEIDIKFWSIKMNVNLFEVGIMLVIKLVKVDYYGGKVLLNLILLIIVEVYIV